MAFTHYGGEAGGIEECASYLRGEAATQFNLGNDRRAEHLRAIAIHFEARAKQVRQQQQEHAPKEGTS